MHKRLIYILLSFPFLFSCTDNFEKNLTKNKIVKHEWHLYMYVDGKENEVVDLQKISYNFKENGELIKTLNAEIVKSSWELFDKNYIRIASSTFKINTLTNNIMSLEYGEDVLYFLPDS